MIEIYQKRRKRSKRLLYRENYHIQRLLGLRPSRYTRYRDYTPEQKQRHIDDVTAYRNNKLLTDPVYKAKHNHQCKAYNQRKRGVSAKHCSKCKVYTAYCDFDERSSGTLRPDCRKCRSKYNKERYELKRLHQG